MTRKKSARTPSTSAELDEARGRLVEREYQLSQALAENEQLRRAKSSEQTDCGAANVPPTYERKHALPTFDPAHLHVSQVPNDLGREIVKLSKVARDLLHGTDPATRKAILLLIAHLCGVKQRDVKKVLHAASELQRKFVP